MAGATSPRPDGRNDRGTRAPAVASAAALACVLLTSASASAQQPAWVGVTPRSALPPSSINRIASPARRDPNAQMLVQANEILYDYTGEQVSAIGGVQIHYGGASLEAERVVYNQRTKVLSASGNVRFTDTDGTVITTDYLELDDQFRNGFVDSLHVETGDKTRVAAARAEIHPGVGDSRLTVFQSGVYTACEPCKEDPKRPPKWQVKAARVIHDQAEKTIYFEDARLELMGVPIAYMPYFWIPDPTVKKKTGLLQPRVLSGTYFGQAFQVPFFWNLAPDYDVTFSPTYTTRQGLLMSTEWRQRLIDGSYAIRAAGIFQQDRKPFAGTSGDRDFRGVIESKGDFRLSERWWYGWDGAWFTDNSFNSQYKVTAHGQEAVSQAYLFGRGPFSYFDMRAIHIYGLSPLDVQRQLPVLHPLLDYKYKLAYPVFGGEVTYNVNFASLTRQQADYDPITAAGATPNPAFIDGLNVCDSADPAAIKTRANCLLRGIPGTYTRLTAEAQWRRTFVDSFGQIFTPFLFVRGDAATLSIARDPSIANFINPGDNSLGRVTPGVGLDYRYPFISTHAWGTQMLEPRAQVIARPSEGNIGRFPNEDAQSLLFDDFNLFSISKFPGYDRVEGGGRANVGLEYTAQFNKGGYVNALFGQSYHLFGLNSYAVGDMANTGLDSGLESARSDYVARMTFRPNTTYSFASRFRFDEQNFDTRRMEFMAGVNFDRWNASLTYGKYDAQPNVGLLLPREGIMPAATLKLTPNWTVGASALYSIDRDRLNTASFSLGYVDECIAINAIYMENYGYRGDIVPNRVFMLSVNLRTLGGTTLSQTVGGLSGGGNSFGLPQ